MSSLMSNLMSSIQTLALAVEKGGALLLHVLPLAPATDPACDSCCSLQKTTRVHNSVLDAQN